jgi:hypothetical protein
MMEVNEWKEFLRKWEEETISLLIDAEKAGFIFSESYGLILEVRRSEAQSFPGAEQDEIQELENRIGKRLPDSYKNFLKASNGWKQLAVDIDNTLFNPASKVDWYRNTDKPSYEILRQFSGDEKEILDSDYFSYGVLIDSDISLRDPDVKNLLAISNHCDSADYFINANVIDANGEWEAIIFLWEEGMIRYHSFAELMIGEKTRTLNNLREVLEL